MNENNGFNGLKVSNDFEGHVMAICALGLLRYGKLINHDETEAQNKVVKALVTNGELHLIHALNRSEALRQGIAHLDSYPEEEGKAQFTAIVTSIVGALLQEWGGTVGVARMDSAMRTAAVDATMRDLHPHLRVVNVAQQAQASDEVLEAIRSGKAKVVELDGNKDLDEQLDALGAPEPVKEALRKISESIKQENPGTKADEAKANDLRKQGRLN